MKILGKIINNIVTDVIVFSDEDFEKGMEHCKNLIKDNESTYVECINNAAIGWLYDGSTGTLYPPQPFPSWVLDSTFTWNAPLVYPSIISEGEGDLLVTYFIYWDEESYQNDKITGWKMVKSNDNNTPKTKYSWNGTGWQISS